MLEKEYFSFGEKRIGSFYAIFLIVIIAGFVGVVIKIESDAIDFSENGAAAMISRQRSIPVLVIDAEVLEVTLKLISGGYVFAEVNDVGVTQIDIFDNDSLKISCFEEAFCAYKFPAGTHNISAKAYDTEGNSVTAEISVSR